MGKLRRCAYNLTCVSLAFPRKRYMNIETAITKGSMCAWCGIRMYICIVLYTKYLYNLYTVSLHVRKMYVFIWQQQYIDQDSVFLFLLQSLSLFYTTTHASSLSVWESVISRHFPRCLQFMRLPAFHTRCNSMEWKNRYYRDGKNQSALWRWHVADFSP